MWAEIPVLIYPSPRLLHLAPSATPRYSSSLGWQAKRREWVIDVRLTLHHWAEVFHIRVNKGQTCGKVPRRTHPINMPNPIQERVLIAASYGHYSPRAARVGPGRINTRSTSRIRFPLFKEGPKITVQNQPGSDLDGLAKFWPNASGPYVPIAAELNQPAISFPLSDLVTFFHRRPRSYYCANPAQIRFSSG